MEIDPVNLHPPRRDFAKKMESLNCGAIKEQKMFEDEKPLFSFFAMSANHQFESFVVVLLVFSLLLSGCAGHRGYSLAELEKDENHYQKVIDKKIELHKQNGETIIGHLTSVERDSIVISSKKKNQVAQKVAKTEIRYFYVLDTSGKAELMVALTLAVLLVLLLSAKGLTDGLSHGY